MKTQNKKKQKKIRQKQKIKDKAQSINLDGLNINKLNINNLKKIFKKTKNIKKQSSKKAKKLQIPSENFIERKSESLVSKLKEVNPFLEQNFEDDTSNFRNLEARNLIENNSQESSRDLNQLENYFSIDYINNSENSPSTKENFEIKKFNSSQDFQVQKNNIRNISLGQDFKFDFQVQSINLNQWQNANNSMGNFNNKMNFEEEKFKDYEKYFTNPEEIAEKNKLPFQKKKF